MLPHWFALRCRLRRHRPHTPPHHTPHPHHTHHIGKAPHTPTPPPPVLPRGTANVFFICVCGWRIALGDRGTRITRHSFRTVRTVSIFRSCLARGMRHQFFPYSLPSSFSPACLACAARRALATALLTCLPATTAYYSIFHRLLAAQRHARHPLRSTRTCLVWTVCERCCVRLAFVLFFLMRASPGCALSPLGCGCARTT